MPEFNQAPTPLEIDDEVGVIRGAGFGNVILQAAIDTAAVAAAASAVASAIAAVIGAAPANLDTLEELATALGNDPAFTTTINALIALKAAKAGDTFTGLIQFTGTGHAGLRFNVLTTAQRDLLTPVTGDTIVNSTTLTVQTYIAIGWVDLFSLAYMFSTNPPPSVSEFAFWLGGNVRDLTFPADMLEEDVLIALSNLLIAANLDGYFEPHLEPEHEDYVAIVANQFLVTESATPIQPRVWPIKRVPAVDFEAGPGISVVTDDTTSEPIEKTRAEFQTWLAEHNTWLAISANGNIGAITLEARHKEIVITLNGNSTLNAAFVNFPRGYIMPLWIIQDATGGRTLAESHADIETWGADALTLNTASGGVTLLLLTRRPNGKICIRNSGVTVA